MDRSSMGDERRWAARYQFLDQLWRGRDRIVCDREIEAALHAGLEGPLADAPTEPPAPAAHRYADLDAAGTWAVGVREDHTAEGFDWNLFVLAGNPAVHSDDRAGSDNVNAGNMFNSPDGIAFDSNGILWIQTDGNYSNEGDFEGQGNNQMLAADTETGEIRRFLVGPISCEITGLAWSPDRKTMFVGVQHPGEKGKPSHWPGGGDTVPRSGVVAVRRDDGGVIG